MISLATSVDDLHSSFKCTIQGHTAECFEKAIVEEQAGRNRSTVIKLLKRGLRMKKQGARHI